MAGGDEGIKTKVGLLGASEYRSGLSDMTRSLTVLNTEMQASQSAFKGNEGSIEALTAKGESLQKIYDKQGEKVAYIAKQLEAAKAEYGENSTQVDNLQIALNRAQTAVNKTGAELETTNGKLDEAKKAEAGAGDASTAMAKDMGTASNAVEDEGKAAGDADGENSALRDGLAKVGEVAGEGLKASMTALAAAFAAVGAAAAAAAKTGFEWAKGAGEMADDVMTLSQQTSVSAQTLQEWTYASNFIDTSVDTMTGSMAKMVKNMGDAAGGSKSAQEKFAALGVSVRDDVTGELRDSEDVFWDSIDALGNVSSETERDALAMDLFGKSAQDLNPLIEAGGDAFRAMGQEARDMGVVFSGGALDAMGSFDDSMQRLNATAGGLKNAIGAALIPAFQPLVDTASSTMAEVSKALQDGLQPGELDGLIDTVINNASDALTDVVGMIGKAMPTVSKALSKLVSSVATELPKLASTLLPAAMELLSSLMDTMAENADELGELASDMVTELIGFLIENAPKMVDASGKIVQGLVDGLLDGDSLSRIVSGAIEMIGSLGAALVKNAILLVAKAPEIIGQLITGILNTDWLAVGTELVQALADGITGAFTNANAVAAAYEQQFGATQEAYDTFKKGLEQADLKLEQSATDAEAKKTLATELLSLYSQLEQKDVKTDADLTLMAGYAAQIAELYPSLGQYIDPVTGLFTTNTAAILQNINAMAQLALVQGYQSYLQSLGDELAKLNIAIGEGTASLKTQYDEWWRLSGVKDNVQALYDTLQAGGSSALTDNLTSIYNAISQYGNIPLGALNGWVDVMADGTVVLKEGVNPAEAYAAAETQLTAAIGNVSEAFDTQNGAYLQSKETLKGMQTDAEAVNGKIGETAKLINEGTTAYNAMVPAAQGAGTAGAQAGADINAGGDAAVEGAGKFGKAAEDMEGADTTAGDVAEGVSAAGSEVQTTAEQIAATVDDLKGAQTAAEGAQTAVAAVATSISTDAATALSTVENACAAIVLYAQAMLEGVGAALEDGTTAVAQAGATMATAVQSAISAILSSTNGKVIGKAYGVGVQDGISSASGGVQNAARNLASAAVNALNIAVNGGGFYSVGTAIANGVASGIRNGSGTIIAAARAAALAAYNAAKRALDINSPSRLMAEIGENYSLGFAEGITGRMGDVMVSARSLSGMAAAETAGGMRTATEQRNAEFEIDYQRLGAEMADALERRGVGTAVMTLDGKVVATSLEPDVSRATYQRAGQTAAGRASRLVIR